MNIPPDDHDLQAYVDGRLDAPERAAVEHWLDAHPERAAEVQQWRRDAQALRAALDGLALPAPTRELDPAALRARRHARTRTRFAIAAALLLCVGLGGGADWQMRGWQMNAAPALAAAGPNGETGSADPNAIFTAASSTMKFRPILPMADALTAYRMVVVNRSASVDYATGQQADLQAWLDRSVGSPIPLPDLVRAGFTPVGGRLFSTEDGGTSAMVFYRDTAGNVVSFYVRPPDAQRRMLKPGSRRDGALLAQYGSQRGYNYAFVAPTVGVSDATLNQAMEIVRG